MAEKIFGGVTVTVDDDGFLTDPNQWTREVAEGLAQGADAYIVKPFSAKQLAGQVEEVLQRSRERV